MKRRLDVLLRALLIALSVLALGAVPPSFAVPFWCVDEQNVMGCASDDNTGTSATCGAEGSGIGPLLTTDTVFARWGTHEPYLNTSSVPVVEIRELSNVTHPIIAHPYGSTILLIDGPLGSAQQIFSGTLTGFTPYNYVSGVLSTMTAWSGAARGQLVYDSTRTAYAQVTSVAGGVATLGPQLAAATNVSTGFFPSGQVVTTWTNGDSIVVYQPVQIQNVVDVDARVSSYAQNVVPSVVLYHLTLSDPTPTPFPSTKIGDGVQLIECTHAGELEIAPRTNGFLSYNSLLEIAYVNAQYGTSAAFWGGAIAELSGATSGDGAIELEGDIALLGTTVVSANIGLSSKPEGAFIVGGAVYASYGQVTIEGTLWQGENGAGGAGLTVQAGSNFYWAGGTKAVQFLLINAGFSDTGQAFAEQTGGSPSTLTLLGPRGTQQLLTGTFTFTNGSPDVTATSATSGLQGNDVFQTSAQPGTLYTVQSVTGTAIVLTANYTGTSASGAVARIQPIDRSTTATPTPGFGGVAVNPFGGSSISAFGGIP